MHLEKKRLAIHTISFMYSDSLGGGPLELTLLGNEFPS